MSGMIGLSVNPDIYNGRFSFGTMLFWGTFYHQHLGEQFGGFAIFGPYGIRSESPLPGLLRPNFESRIENFDGTEGIGYCGLDQEPLNVFTRMGEVALCFSGNIINSRELLGRFTERGRIFDLGKSDGELMANLIFKEQNIIQGIKEVGKDIEGAFAILILTSQGIYAAISPDSHWPLVLGKQPGAAIVACESGGFGNLGFERDRDLKPGEIVLLKDGKCESLDLSNNLIPQICKFAWVYTAHPTASIYAVPASLVRERLGAALARADIEAGFIPDVVSCVPDSGRCHGSGYHNECCRAMNEGRIKRVPIRKEVVYKYPYAGRSFMPSDDKRRRKEAYFKMLPTAERFDGQVLVLCEDSVVRGVQIGENLAPKLRGVGFKEIHVRASNPELRSHCPWGKTTQKGEVLADLIPDLSERAKFLGVDSIKYNTLDALYDAIGLPPQTLCVDCALRR